MQMSGKEISFMTTVKAGERIMFIFVAKTKKGRHVLVRQYKQTCVQTFLQCREREREMWCEGFSQSIVVRSHIV